MAVIIVDAFGGDNAPLEVLKGCERAVSELGVEIILTGNKDTIKKCGADNGISLKGMKIEHTTDVFDIHDEPKEIIRSGSSTSMAVGLRLLAEGKGDAFVSAGSTGALVMGSTFIVKRIKGIKRIAPSPVLPADKGSFVLLDAGAGDGEPFDWSVLENFDRPFFLAGGLGPENIMEAIRKVHPYAVDVSSGIETEGSKDPAKMEAFVKAVHEAD